MRLKLLFIVVASFVGFGSYGQITITTGTLNYSQNFDGLVGITNSNITWANNSNLTGWYLYNGSNAAITIYGAETGSTGNATYCSYGATSGNTERALGSVGSGGTYWGSPSSGAVAGYLAVALTNSSGNTINSATIGFDGEQWRNSGNATAQTMTMQYGFGATFATVGTWTTAGSTFNLTSPIATATTAAVDGNIAGKIGGLGGTISSLNWTNTSILWLRWVETNDSGNDHALAIDNFTFSATLPSSDATLSVLTTTATGLSPVFASATTAYTASVPNATTSVTVSPTRNEANATIQVQVNGGGYSSITSGSASGALNLNVGSNTIAVKVTAQDGTTINTYTITVTRASASTDEVDYANVQFPGTGNIILGGVFNVYAQTYESGVTEAVGAGTGIVSWIGYSSSNTNPSSAGWTWVPASFNTQSGNNDEFVANIGTALPAGNYFYASRFQLNGGPYKYGGFSSGFSSGFWDGTTNVNGTLTVNPHLVDWANLQSPSTATITQGSTFTAYGQVYEPGVTNISSSQGSGITVEFGISPLNSNTNPNTWTNWTTTSYNNSCLLCGDLDNNGIPDNDEYYATTGGALTAGTYYYTFRYSLNGGPYMYGGYNGGGGGFWNGTTDVSGTLTVTAPPICGSESFTNSNTSSTNYTDGSYTGDNGVTWSYIKSRSDAGYQITGSGIMLQDLSNKSKITSASVVGGIGNFTCKLLKAFTGAGNRQVELFINGVSYGTSIAWDNTAVQTFSVNNINIGGNVIVEIRNNTAKQVTVDDISWTCYTSCAPIVTSPTAASITATTATLGGNITSIGCSGVTVRGIEWSTTSGFANGTGTQVATSGSFATGVFTQAVTGLPSGTVIYYKAFATNLTGTGYSGISSFTTPITNDLCNGVIDLTVNAVAKAAIMTGSTATTPFTEKDVWFSFTPSCSGTHNIKVTGFSGDIDIELYSVACPTSATYLDNSSGTTATETITSSLIAGTTYYLRVLAWDTTAATTAFTAQVTSDSTLTINNTGSPATGFIISGTTNVVVMGFTTTPNCATSYNLTGVTISKTGSSTTTDISNLRIFYDANSNGIVDGGETSVSGTGIALTGSLVFTLSGQTGITTARNYLLVADVAVSAIGGTTFTGKITTSNNLTAVLTPTGTVTGTATGNTQTITYAGPEINVTTNTPSNIPTGSVAGTGFNTQFAATAIGASTAAKTYRIYNLGSSTLNVSAVTSSIPTEFTVTSSTPYTIAPGAYVSFTVIFSPSSSGTRTAVISIANNDSTNDGTLTENPYTFSVKGDGTCAATINTITPTSGPIGTEVTINSAADLTGATVNFNGVSATVVQISLNQIKVIVPVGATSGNLVTTNAIGCSSTNAFTVIKNVGNSCEGGSLASDLFISEVTDSNYGGLTYIEIYNGTGVDKPLSGYSINTASNGGAYSPTPLNLSSVTLAAGSTYVVALGDDDLCTSPRGDGSLAAQAISGLGINFDPYQNTSPPKGNDHIALFYGGTLIDSWGVFGNPSWATSTLSMFATETDGATFRRKNTATLPSTTYNNSDWDIIDYVGTDKADCSSNDYSDIGTYNFISGTPPTVAIPSYTATCKTATLTVSGTEGYNGTSPADTKELTYQWLVSAPNATGWTAITDNANYTGSSSATLSITNISTVINYQYYCQIRENTNTCYTASNAIKIIDGTITWNGTDWRDVNNSIATPSLSKLAVINADYNTSIKGSFDACSLVVNSLYTFTITANEYVKIQNDLTNNGILNIQDKGSLVQVNDNGVNTGDIDYVRTTNTGIYNTDYTYWSSPVAGFTLGDVSRNNTLSDKYYSYEPTITGEDWKQESALTDMLFGIGYIIRGPEYTPLIQPGDTYTATFVGVPNNGSKSISPIYADKSYLLGNPYPSALDADTFLIANKDVLNGTLYFWTHNTAIQDRNLILSTAGSGTLAYTSNDYATYNLTGGVGAIPANLDPITLQPITTESAPSDPLYPNGKIPTGKIASGQGFFASSIISATPLGNIIFNNSMRVGVLDILEEDNSQFFKTRSPKTKTAAIEKHRIWLDLTNSQGAFKQTLIGYITNATNEYDTRFDGESFDANEFVDFYSLNQNKNLVIQGRALPFNDNDEVPLGFRTTIEGTFTINIDQVDGVLTNQAVYIEDKFTNTVFDLKTGNYTFNTVAGTFNDRFLLRYTNKTLGTNDFETLENQVLVSNKNKQIKVNSAVETIDKVLVYDLLGRELFKKEKVNSNELTLTNFNSSQQTLLVKVSLQNGQTVTRKVMY
jgi:hypothetical protein